MSSAAPVAGSRTPFVQAVWRAVTWRMLLVAQLIGLSVSLARYFERRGADLATMGYLHGNRAAMPAFFNSHAITMAVGAVLITVAAVAADEAVRRGTGMWRAFAIALFSASCATAIVQWCLRASLGVDHEPGAGFSITRLALAALDVGVVGGLGTLAYLNRQIVQRMLAGLRAAELERVQVERHLIESRLATAQAQIDPGLVLKQLGEIRDLYAVARAGADDKLEALIQQLRVSVARSSSAGASREVRA